MDHLSPLLVKTDLRSFFTFPKYLLGLFSPKREGDFPVLLTKKGSRYGRENFVFFWNLLRSELKMYQILSMKFWNVRNCTLVRGHFWPVCLRNVDFAQPLPPAKTWNPQNLTPMEIEKTWIHPHVEEGANNNLKTHAQRTFALGPRYQWPLHHII